MSSHVWVCSKCTRERSIDSIIGCRMRFPGEKCPSCADPGVGMGMIAINAALVAACKEL